MNHSVVAYDQSRRVDCFSSDNYISPHCPLQSCDACQSLKNLDIQIAHIRNRLVDFVNTRFALKRKINHRHDRFIHRLPPELVSEIFRFCDPDPFRACIAGLSPVALVLGGVCKLWRDVTLQTPQLWSSIKITFKESHHDGNPYRLDVAKEWLHRSRSLPLNINIDFDKYNIPLANSNRQLCAIINLVRSHSSRWENVIVSVRKACHLHAVLNNLQDAPENLESLSIGLRLSEEEENISFDMQQVLLPKYVTLALENPVLWELPCSWEHLTHLTTTNIHLDELLLIIRYASNLTQCTATDIEPESGVYDLPATPIVNHSITYLHASDTHDDSLFNGPQLVLASLQFLVYDYHYMKDDDSAIENLLSFLRRSSPPLIHFVFRSKAQVRNTHARAWYKMLPSITSVEFYTGEIPIPGGVERMSYLSHITSTFLDSLANPPSYTPLLPNLRALSLNVNMPLTPEHWSALCVILEGHTQGFLARRSESSTELSVISPASVRRGVLLSQVWINGEGRKSFQASVDPQINPRIQDLVKRGLDLRFDGVPYHRMLEDSIRWLQQRHFQLVASQRVLQ